MIASMRARPLLWAASLGSLACATAGQAQRAVVSGSASVQAGMSSNPFLERNGDSSAYGELEIAPRLQLTSPSSSTDISARYRRTEYADHYDGTDEFQASIAHDQRLNERMRLSLGGDFLSSLDGQSQLGIDGVPTGTTPAEPGALDPQFDLLGGRQRRNNLSLRSGLDVVLNEQSTLHVTNQAERLNYVGAGVGQSYWSYGGAFDYSHSLGSLASVGATINYEWTDYDGPSGTHSFVWGPQLHYHRQVNQWMTVDVSGGATFIGERLNGVTRNSTIFGGSLRSCMTYNRSALCAAASRDASATGLGIVSPRNNLSLTYTNRFGENDQIRLGAEYSHVGGNQTPLGNVPIQQASSVSNLFAAAETRIGRKIALGTNINYRRLSDSTGGHLSDVNGMVFLRIFYGPGA